MSGRTPTHPAGAGATWRRSAGTRWAAGASDDAAATALAAVVGDLLAQRQDARAARDFAAADGIRSRLTAAGVSVEDSPDGPTWSLKDA